MRAARLYRGPTHGWAWLLADSNVPLGVMQVSIDTELVLLTPKYRKYCRNAAHEL